MFQNPLSDPQGVSAHPACAISNSGSVGVLPIKPKQREEAQPLSPAGLSSHMLWSLEAPRPHLEMGLFLRLGARSRFSAQAH